jgi:hypothetical protein
VNTTRRVISVGALALGMLLVTAGAVAAHAGHKPLPEGFASKVVGVMDLAGAPVDLPGVTWQPAGNGMGLSIASADARVVQIAGEQAGEPLLRVSAELVEVNARSPQAADVDGSGVDPARAAELVDLLQGNAPPEWVRLEAAGTASWLDHRPIGHAHEPDRSAYRSGERSEEWEVAFSVDGVPHRLVGEVIAVGDDPTSPWLLAGGAGAGLVLALAGGVGWTVRRRRRASTPTDADEPRSLHPVG